MTLHRRNKQYSIAYARRKLAEIDRQLERWHAKTPKDWRESADKRQALNRLDAERPRWDRLVHPRVDEEWKMPF